MPRINELDAMEVLDSRGRPTVWARCTVDGFSADVSVPSGASTGAAEALELRDRDPTRYRGLGCRSAVANVTGPIRDALRGSQFASQEQLDNRLIELDGTSDKSRLGANAILAVSLSFARAHAAAQRIPLYQHFAQVADRRCDHLPRLTINLFSGGKHAGGQVCIQDVLMVPQQLSIDASLACAFAVYQAASELILEKYRMRVLRADEGGLAPPFPNTTAMLADAVESIQRAGLRPGDDVALAVDVAASHFARNEEYVIDGERLISRAMIHKIEDWVDQFPILSIEDGLHQEDWTHWPMLRQKLAGRAMTIGDDLLCTNPARIARAIDAQAADALLLKVNQIGTLSEACAAMKQARRAGWKIVASARSGETEDDWLADLAVGWGADQIKVGSITQSERLAKYNRLLQIERDTGLPIRNERQDAKTPK
jgi:enolase